MWVVSLVLSPPPLWATCQYFPLSLPQNLSLLPSLFLLPFLFFSLLLFHRLHEFQWHGTDPTNKTRKVPGALRFTKLRVIPDQFYYNIDDVSMWERGGLEGVRWRGARSEGDWVGLGLVQ